MRTFTGTVACLPIAGVPVVGLFRLSRLLGPCARRLEVQERLTWQVAEALDAHFKVEGAAVLALWADLMWRSDGVVDGVAATSADGVAVLADAVEGAVAGELWAEFDGDLLSEGEKVADVYGGVVGRRGGCVCLSTAISCLIRLCRGAVLVVGVVASRVGSGRCPSGRPRRTAVTVLGPETSALFVVGNL
ncbi:GTP cyclohydrolase I-like protein [Amycolatopsis cihanbeyliensis]|uniref:GTP cyclohydrolase I-like protein n=1 Tax=Amycolatopsis cihanbeyliensis TaxID=1128664 RepID=A0A542DF04_AMYCI|nr:GTP cyclohydrolase I-like protein [Amycolatopsis cihanbeyliensis]